MNIHRRLRSMTGVLIAVILSFVLSGCSSDRKDSPRAETAVLSIRVTLHDDIPSGPFRMHDTRAGEYDADKFAANYMEKMHTLRVIIISADNTVEHNTLWDFTSSPAEHVSGGDFPVKAGEMKTILLVANENGKTVRKSDGSAVSASDYLGRLSATVGTLVDLNELKKTVIPESAIATDPHTGMLTEPMFITAVYNYYIGTDRERYSATFNIHRTLTKYTFRITNKDKTKPHKLDFIDIDRVASFCWLFPNAEYQDSQQTLLVGYHAADTSNGKIMTYQVSETIGAGETREFGPYYFPEGADLGASGSYSVGFGFDGFSTGWRRLEWFKPENPDVKFPMTDLPRNTHVVVNVSFEFLGIGLNYTVCPWNMHEIDIPPFN